MDRHGRAVIGYNVSEANSVGDCVPLTISQSPARLFLSLLHTLELDDSETFLTTSKSSYMTPVPSASLLAAELSERPSSSRSRA